MTMGGWIIVIIHGASCPGLLGIGSLLVCIGLVSVLVGLHGGKCANDGGFANVGGPLA